MLLPPWVVLVGDGDLEVVVGVPTHSMRDHHWRWARTILDSFSEWITWLLPYFLSWALNILSAFRLSNFFLKTEAESEDLSFLYSFFQQQFSIILRVENILIPLSLDFILYMLWCLSILHKLLGLFMPIFSVSLVTPWVCRKGAGPNRPPEWADCCLFKVSLQGVCDGSSVGKARRWSMESRNWWGRRLVVRKPGHLGTNPSSAPNRCDNGQVN